RVITAECRSRSYINGTPCPQGDLKALGELLIDIHSQHEHDGRSQALGLVIYTVFCSGLTILALSSICLIQAFF
ncbi:MAG: hypothetical protein EOO38_32325, partial [Cytophagaceae bacterium]